jgi:signal recognition particle receptor subunit beta
MREREEDNIFSLNNLKENLATYKKDIKRIPIVMQYNKRDLATHGVPLLPIDLMEKELNSELGAPYFEASALKGINVINTLKKIVMITMEMLQKELE